MKSNKTKKIIKTVVVVIFILFAVAIIALIINSLKVIDGTPIREITLNEGGVVFD